MLQGEPCLIEVHAARQAAQEAVTGLRVTGSRVKDSRYCTAGPYPQKVPYLAGVLGRHLRS